MAVEHREGEVSASACDGMCVCSISRKNASAVCPVTLLRHTRDTYAQGTRTRKHTHINTLETQEGAVVAGEVRALSLPVLC